MFTGLVEAVGELVERKPTSGGFRLRIASALDRLGVRGVGSLLLEGGAALHAGAWDEGLVDFVRLYVTPHVLGSAGVPLLLDRGFRSAELGGRRVEQLGPDVLIEGYVHRSR